MAKTRSIRQSQGDFLTIALSCSSHFIFGRPVLAGLAGFFSGEDILAMGVVMDDFSVKIEVAKVSFEVSEDQRLVRVGRLRLRGVKKNRKGTWKSEER